MTNEDGGEVMSATEMFPRPENLGRAAGKIHPRCQSLAIRHGAKFSLEKYEHPEEGFKGMYQDRKSLSIDGMKSQ